MKRKSYKKLYEEIKNKYETPLESTIFLIKKGGNRYLDETDHKQIDEEIDKLIQLTDGFILLLSKQETSSEEQKWQFMKERKIIMPLADYQLKLSYLNHVYGLLSDYQMIIEQQYEVLKFAIAKIIKGD